MKKITLLLLIIIANVQYSLAQDYLQVGLDAISEREARAQMDFLASDEMQGRMAGTPYGRISARYIAAELQELGLQPQFDHYSTALRQSPDKLTPMQNVLAIIPGRDTTKSIIIGAHYDHLGVDKNGDVFNGADDNASGVVAVLQVARAIVAAGETPGVNIVLALWDGEEGGLTGSKHYVEELHDTLSVKSYINFDMVGRIGRSAQRPEQISFIYTENDAFLKDTMSSIMAEYDLKGIAPDYRPASNKMGGSDNAYFNRNGVPIVFWHSGVHDDYHKVSDTVEKLSWPKIMDVARASYLLVWKLAQGTATK